MSYHYIDAKREADPHALADVETFYVGTIKDWKDPLDCYLCSDWSADEQTSHSEHIGWHYAYGTPGYLWDSDPIGPFETEEEALREAREAAGYCEHGISEDEICEGCPAPELWVGLVPYGRHSGWYVAFNQGEYTLVDSCLEAAAFSKPEGIPDIAPFGVTLRPVKLSDADARRWGRDSG